MFYCPVDAHCELRLLEQRHALDWYNLVDGDRSHIRPWFGWLDDFKTVDDARTFIQVAQNQFAANAGLKAAIWVDGQLAGGVSIQEIDWSCSTAVIGYWLLAAYEGRGIATKCTKTLMDYIFGQLKINRIEARCAVDNKKSRAIPERLGFTMEGIVRESQWLYDHYLDEAVYSLLSYEWQLANIKSQNIMPFISPKK